METFNFESPLSQGLDLAVVWSALCFLQTKDSEYCDANSTLIRKHKS